MRGGADLKADRGSWHLGEEREEFTTRRPPTDHSILGSINTVHLENVLDAIDASCRNLLHGKPLLMCLAMTTY